MLEKLGGRKFVSLLVFVVVVVANGAFHVGLSNETLVILAGVLGVYNAANVIQKATIATDAVEDVFDEDAETPVDDEVAPEDAEG